MTKKRATTKHHSEKVHETKERIDPLLIENFISLQRVLTNLSLKLDNLATQTSKLLELFEISAKALAEKDFDLEQGNKDLIEKLDNLVDQNKTLARGMTLLHERLPAQEVFVPQQQMQPQLPPMPQVPQYMNQRMPPQQQMAPPKMREMSMPPKKPMLTKTREFDDNFTQETPSEKTDFDEGMSFP